MESKLEGTVAFAVLLSGYLFYRKLFQAKKHYDDSFGANIFSESYANLLDKEDPLSEFQSQFIYPKHNGENVVYFCGNSLGLQPKGTVIIMIYM